MNELVTVQESALDKLQAAFETTAVRAKLAKLQAIKV